MIGSCDPSPVKVDQENKQNLVLFCKPFPASESRCKRNSIWIEISYQVSSFYRFSPLIKQYNTTVVLLDIEATFAETGEKTDRIDMMLYHTVKRQLIFVEVKRLSDKRLYAQPGSSEAEIIEQMKLYKKRIIDEKDKIKAQYDCVIEYYNQLSGKNLQPIGDGEHLLGLLVVECSEVECFDVIVRMLRSRIFVPVLRQMTLKCIHTARRRTPHRVRS